MATIIDSLIVTLGLDKSSYDAGAGKVDQGLADTEKQADKTSAAVTKTGTAAQKSGQQTAKAGKTSAASYTDLASKVAKYLALIGGTVAIKRFVEQTVESSAALQRFATNLQQDVSSISAWSQEVEKGGGSAEGLQGTLAMLSQAQTELQLTGESSLIPYFAALGLSMADASGKARAGSDILLDMADRLSKLDRTTAFNLGHMMGVDTGTLNLLLRGRAEVEALLRKQREATAVTKQQGQEAVRLQRAMIGTRQEFQAFGRELLSDATPVLEKFFSIMTTIGQWVRDNKEFVGDFFTVLATGLALVAAATIPISGTAAAVLGLAAAIAALWDDYQTFKRGGDSLIDWSKWEPGINAAKTGLQWIRDLMEDIFYRAFALGHVLSGLINHDYAQVKLGADEFFTGTRKKYGEGEEAPAPAAAEADATDRTQKAIKYFQNQGWSRNQAIGIAANIERESKFNPAASGDNGKAYGLAQWHPDRQADFKAAFGKDIQDSSFAEQLAFIQFELTHKEKAAGEKLKATDSPIDAAKAVSNFYERPAEKLKATDSPIDAAKAVSNFYERPAEKQKEADKRGDLGAAFGRLPGAGNAAQGAGAAAGAAAKAPVTSGDVSKSVETHIGQITVNTQATDAKGLANDLGKSLNMLFTGNANYGLT